MKKIYILAAIALVAGVSCTKQVPADNNSQDVPIGFSPISQKIGTKAQYFGEQDVEYSGYGTKYESFKVWSIFNQTAITKPGQSGTEVFFAGIIANPNNGAGATTAPDYWSLATPYYWPKAGFLSFHAFSPSEATGLSLDHTWGAGFTAGYVVPTDASAHVDLLYSNYEFNKKRTDYTTGFPYDDDNNSVYKYNGVNIMFNHALASIQFKVQQNDTYTGHTITVKKIEILNPYSTGTFHENRANADLNNGYDVLTASQPTNTERIINVWSTSATNAPYWDVNNTIEESTPYVAYNGTGIATTTTAQLARTNYVLAMPQTLDHTATTGNKVQIKVTYDYTFGSQTLTNQVATVDISGLTGTDTDESNQTVNKWLINHRYIYTINFKLEEIIFDPAVTDYVQVTATVDVSASTVS